MPPAKPPKQGARDGNLTDVLFLFLTIGEYKGETYEEVLQDRHKTFIWNNALEEMVEQATRQEASRDGRPIIWFFNSKAVKDAVQAAFGSRFPDIRFVWLPMPRKMK